MDKKGMKLVESLPPALPSLFESPDRILLLFPYVRPRTKTDSLGSQLLGEQSQGCL